jgi:alpha-beta hydrolase superfamily lysophospholipase
MRHVLLAALLCTWTLAAQATPVQLSTSDGVTLQADDSGKGSHGVVLLHDQGRTSADWRLFADKLATKGYRVITVNLRGHGESASIMDATEPDWAAMTQDVASAIAYLRKKGATRVSMVGAGLGANLAVDVASRDTSVTSVVLLSPGLNIKGYKPSQTVAAYGQRPMLLAAGMDDAIASNTVKYLERQAKGQKRAVYLSGSQSGADLLEGHPELEDGVLAWLAGNYESAGGLSADTALNTGDIETLQSEGKRFGEK